MSTSQESIFITKELNLHDFQKVIQQSSRLCLSCSCQDLIECNQQKHDVLILAAAPKSIVGGGPTYMAPEMLLATREGGSYDGILPCLFRNIKAPCKYLPVWVLLSRQVIVANGDIILISDTCISPADANANRADQMHMSSFNRLACWMMLN